MSGSSGSKQDVFPLLELDELVICLQSCDFSMATAEHISRPSSQYVVTLYKQIIENFMGISPDQLLTDSSRFHDMGDVDNEQDVSSENPGSNAFYNDTLQILTLNKICYKFFENIGISDFNIMDLYKPEAFRTRRLLSAVINYARFREERMFDCNQFIIQMESMLEELKNKFDDFNYLRAQLTAVEDDDEKKPGELEELTKQNKVLETNLKKLTIVQENLSIDYNSYKMKKQELLQELESTSFELIELESKRERLASYNDDENNLHTTLNESIAKLAEEKELQLAHVKNLESNVKNLEVSVETLESAIESVYEVLQFLSTELQESHRSELSVLEIREPLVEKKDRLQNILKSNVLYKHSILTEQIEALRNELNNTTNEYKLESEENKEIIARLRNKYDAEIKDKESELDQYIRDEITEKKLKVLQAELIEIQKTFNEEIDEIELHYSTLIGHINNYMKNILSSIDSR
ncbi:Kinetochore protein NUF2 [Nakaseomyces bracarensis]|uniref:Kinetochore protein NUF2 n=1 Tax=Nakaseomyces bracarensis TaxID=273131 RepID=A0ABR4NQ63_9SACH